MYVNLVGMTLFTLGPTPLPIVGNLLSILRNPPGEDCYVRWAKQYGPIYTFWMGEFPIILVSDTQQLQEAFVKDGETFAGRILNHEVDTICKGGTYGVINTEGDLWRDHRRFTLHVLRDFGFGRNIMQEKILTEIEERFGELNAQIAAHEGAEFDINEIIEVAVGSIINALIFGYRFCGEQVEEFFRIKNYVAEIMRKLGLIEFNLLSMWPGLFYRIPHFQRFAVGLRENFESLHSFLMGQIERHAAEIDLENLDEPPTDYVEAFLKEKERRERRGEIHNFDMNQLVHMLADLWGAGQETTATTLAWEIGYIICSPHVQDRIHAELDAVIGTTDRFVTIADKPKLPYICAVINEAQRLANLLPINLLHRATRDTTIGGYFIPKNSCVVPQMSTIHYDEKVFPQPKEFRPERFLNSEGQLQKCDDLLPFSLGKRQCLGESLAKMELFLFTANIFHRYKITRGKELPTLQRNAGGVIVCPRYKCKVEKRNFSTNSREFA